MSQPWTTSASASIGGEPGTITLVEGPSFSISRTSGDMETGYPHGVFFRDTRYLSELCVLVNGQLPEPLSASSIDPFSAAFVLRSQPRPGEADSGLLIFRQRYVGRGMREDITVRNYGEEPAFCALEVLTGADFADLFEVKEGRIEKIGHLETDIEEQRITWSYRRGTFARGARLEFSQPGTLSSGHAAFEFLVPPDGEWSLCMQLTPIVDGTEVTPRYLCGRPVERATPVARLEQWIRDLPTITSEHDGFTLLLDRSTKDLAALRLFDAEFPDRTVVAAGAPWFMTLFGRDSLLTSWMAMMVDSDLALGTLQTLALHQGADVNPITEEEPGRILHEMRFGESAELSLGGGRIYYGSVDATPLFVMLLGELERWGNRRDEVDALLPAADRALRWIDDFGDRDGDRYVEYLRTSDRGLRNQGWKDSHDSVRFADGTLAEPPVALCEVQGYVYAALIARSRFAQERGDEAYADELMTRARDLKTRFNRDFWIEEHGWLAMGLDRDKRPIDALTSNMGHCLWTAILDEDKAAVVAQRLLSRQMFSGWGIRTMASDMVGYNPISYHNGSVWPHDNALCVAGLMRYGFDEEAHRVMQGVVDAGSWFGSRLPELYAGLGRSEFNFPVSYPTSCSPQAWAAASPLLFLRSMLHFDPDVRHGKLHLVPSVPDWIGCLRIEGVPIAGGRVSFEVSGDTFEVLEQPEGLTILDRPRRPGP